MKYPPLILTFFMVNLFLLVLSSPSSCQPPLPPIDLTKVKATQLPYRLEIEKVLTTLENEIFIAADLNDDGEDEIVLKKTGEEKPNFISLKEIKTIVSGFKKTSMVKSFRIQPFVI